MYLRPKYPFFEVFDLTSKFSLKKSLSNDFIAHKAYMLPIHQIMCITLVNERTWNNYFDKVKRLFSKEDVFLEISFYKFYGKIPK